MPVTLTAAGCKTLKKRARGARTPWRDWLRARIVLVAARGRGNARIVAGPAHNRSEHPTSPNSR